jgi:hypothetical protein
VQRLGKVPGGDRLREPTHQQPKHFQTLRVRQSRKLHDRFFFHISGITEILSKSQDKTSTCRV